MKRLLLCMMLITTTLSIYAETSSSTSFLTPRRKRLAKYFGVSALAAYISMNVLNKNAQAKVSQKRLLAYATGIPVVLGFGYHIGRMYTNLQNDAISGKSGSDEDIKEFMTTYAGISTVGTFGYLCVTTKLSGDPLYPGKLAIDSLGYTGTSCGILASSYFASLLWAETGLMQAKAP